MTTADITNNSIIKFRQNKDIVDNTEVENSKCPCSVWQLLAIAAPIGAILLFAALFVPLYVVNHKKRDIKLIVTNNTEVATEDEYEENIINITYATLTPKNGYDNILIFLGGISDYSSKYFDFFKSTELMFLKEQKYIFFQDNLEQCNL